MNVFNLTTAQRIVYSTVYTGFDSEILTFYGTAIESKIGCPLISLGSKTKRNESKNERRKKAKKKVSFACFDLKRKGIFWMRNEMIRSEK